MLGGQLCSHRNGNFQGQFRYFLEHWAGQPPAFRVPQALHHFLVGIGFPLPLRDFLTCHLFLLTLRLELTALVACRGTGNLFILFPVVLTVLLLRYGTRTALVLLSATGLLGAVGYCVLALILSPESRLIWRVRNTFEVLTAPLPRRINWDLRTALFAALQGGIFGAGRDNLYLLNKSLPVHRLRFLRPHRLFRRCSSPLGGSFHHSHYALCCAAVPT